MSATLSPAEEMKTAPQPDSSLIRMKRPSAYYDGGSGKFWIEDASGVWISINETSLKRQLRACGFSATIREHETISDLDRCINTIQLKFNVAYVGPLAGYQKGITEAFGKRILVSESPKIIEPSPGGFPLLRQLTEQMFGEDQLPYVKGWLKTGYESLRNGLRRPGQVLALAGEHDSFKSVLQNLITEMLGGRAAKPYRYMSGGTDFNRELFGAEHLMIEDESASTDIRARRHFGARIKDFTVNQVQSCHGKNREALSLTPFWRVSVSMNSEPENLLVMPPLDESLRDKIILLLVRKGLMPMPTFTDEERAAFWKALTAELPAFLHHLTQWEIPQELKSQRFGITHYQHPELVQALEESAPETILLGLIDSLFNTQGYFPAQGWEGTAEELQTKLMQTHEFEAKKLFSWNGAAGTYLGRLARKKRPRVMEARTGDARRWRISPPGKVVTP
jgi:hypothetical protein